MLSIACQDGNHQACMRAGCGCLICAHEARPRHPADPPDMPAEAPTASRAAPVAVEAPTVPRDAKKPRNPRKPRGPYHDLPVDQLARLYTVEGWRLRQIGHLYGVSRQTVKLRLEAAGVPIRRQGDCSKRLPDAEIAARYQAGERTSVLAAEFGVNETTIVAHLRKAGVSIRPSGVPSTRLESQV